MLVSTNSSTQLGRPVPASEPNRTIAPKSNASSNWDRQGRTFVAAVITPSLREQQERSGDNPSRAGPRRDSSGSLLVPQLGSTGHDNGGLAETSQQQQTEKSVSRLGANWVRRSRHERGREIETQRRKQGGRKRQTRTPARATGTPSFLVPFPSQRTLRVLSTS